MIIKAKEKRSASLPYYLPVIVSLLMVLLLLLLPTGFEDAVIYKGTERCRASVLSIDESKIISTGLIRSGEQLCTVNIMDGRFKGQIVEGVNLLTGSLEKDKIFKEKDTAYIIVSFQEDNILSVNLIDHYRIDKSLILALLFAALLFMFAGKTGIRAILSFLLTILCIWKILVPSYLKGIHPILVGMMITLFLTVIIIGLVYGFDKRCLSAVGGSFLGIVTTCILGIIFTNSFGIHGAIMPYSESLLYSGFEHLNLTQIFMASIFIGASGAVMDLAVDITSSVAEVVEKKPDITSIEAMASGMRVGRAAMGTMTTTLLFAYSGGYIAMLMVFMAQGTPILNIINYKYVSAQILDTIVGSFGLVTVAPFTAFCSGLLLTKKTVPGQN